MISELELKNELSEIFDSLVAEKLTRILIKILERTGSNETRLDRIERILEELVNQQKELAKAQIKTEQRIDELVEAQKRSEQRIDELAKAQIKTEQRIDELVEAQKRSEQRIDELAKAQIKTEQRIDELVEAQKRSEQRIDELAKAQIKTEQRIDELVEAQKRTEQRIDELVEAQKRSEQRIDELAEAQKRSEQRIEELAKAQIKTEKELAKLTKVVKGIQKTVGDLSNTVGYGLEDMVYPNLPYLLKDDYNIICDKLTRGYIEYNDGQFNEINVYGTGIKDNKKIYIIGECKVKFGVKDIYKYERLLKRVKMQLKDADIFPVAISYQFIPRVQKILKEKNIPFYFSYQIKNYVQKN